MREILISESAWEEMTCLFAPSLMDEFFKDFQVARGNFKIEFYYPENNGNISLLKVYRLISLFIKEGLLRLSTEYMLSSPAHAFCAGEILNNSHEITL
ncbi:DUF1493 family protein [Citrobacter sp. RHBSTW-00671]|uniref:DUF1493 family protein n=1 Tax=Citrobacter sp. RHBSTW-00671 TaxID=2742660 RepID=UPI002E12B720